MTITSGLDGAHPAEVYERDPRGRLAPATLRAWHEELVVRVPLLFVAHARDGEDRLARSIQPTVTRAGLTGGDPLWGVLGPERNRS
jgi:hypothetical protein